MNIEKLSDTEVQISETITKTETTTLDQLNYDRDSLVRTQQANTDFATAENAKIDALIADIDAKISQIKGLGVMTQAEFEIANPVATTTPEIIQ